MGQTQDHASGELRPRFSGGGDELWDFVIVDGRNDGGDHHPCRNARLAKLSKSIEARLRGRSSRLENGAQFRIQTGQGYEDHHRTVVGELLQEINIPRDQTVLGNDADGVAEISEHFKAGPGDAKFSFNRLIAIGDTAHGDDVRFPAE